MIGNRITLIIFLASTSPSPTVITLKATAGGKPFSSSGEWTWKGRALEMGTMGEITLKIKAKGDRVSGRWSESGSRNADGFGPVSEIEDVWIVDAHTIRFRRCFGEISYVDAYFGTIRNRLSTFKKCTRDRWGALRPGQTVIDYTGTISGDELIVKSQ
jgi:hypothetical protein